MKKLYLAILCLISKCWCRETPSGGNIFYVKYRTARNPIIIVRPLGQRRIELVIQ